MTYLGVDFKQRLKNEMYKGAQSASGMRLLMERPLLCIEIYVSPQSLCKLFVIEASYQGGYSLDARSISSFAHLRHVSEYSFAKLSNVKHQPI